MDVNDHIGPHEFLVLLLSCMLTLNLAKKRMSKFKGI